VTQVQTALSTVSTQRVFYGNGLNQITLSENFLSQDKVNLSSQENSLMGVDRRRRLLTWCKRKWLINRFSPDWTRADVATLLSFLK